MDGMGGVRQKGSIYSTEAHCEGAAGTGKSYIINTIVSYLRRMFGDNDVVHILAPPGIAAFNVLGETLHRFAGIDWKNPRKGMSYWKVQDIQKILQTTITLLVDERSMLSQEIVALLEKAVAKTGHECGHAREDWGDSQL
jgi:hypothetical protein